VDDLTDIERQLLRAALELGFGPDTDLSRANTARVVNRVLAWRGLSAEQIDDGWRSDGCPPDHATVYAALARMTQERHSAGPGRAPERPGPALFEGGGNWGAPGDPDAPACAPQYNSCRLTEEGERRARALAH
jgi:hypothetical protein